MQRVIVPFVVLWCVLLLGVAHAEVITIDGTIRSVDGKNRTITVETGTEIKTFDVSSKAKISVEGKDANLDSLKLGQKAKLSYHDDLEIVLKVEVESVSLQAGAEGDVTGVHDPCVIKEGNTYFLYSTGGLLPMRRSDDLVTWRSVGEALPELPAWAKKIVPEANGCWAPDISYFNGKYHLYYSVSTFGSNRSCIGLATNATLYPESPKYEWMDQGLVVQSRPS